MKKPILGADFLTAYGLVVDLQWGVITSNKDQHLVLPCSLHVLSSNSDFSINRIHRLLEEKFRDMAGYEPFQNPLPVSTVYHSVDTADAAPLHCKVRPLLGEKLAAAKAAFAKMEAAGVIRCSNSPRSSPLHMLRKKNVSWRPYGDYRCLNQITVPDWYPMAS